MLTVVYKLFYPRNNEQAGSILEKKLQHLVMFKQMQVISKQKKRRKITFTDVGMAHVKCLLLNVTDWAGICLNKELRVWFSVLCLGFGSQSVPTPSAELLHFWCVVSYCQKRQVGAVEMTCVLLSYSLFPEFTFVAVQCILSTLPCEVCIGTTAWD